MTLQVAGGAQSGLAPQVPAAGAAAQTGPAGLAAQELPVHSQRPAAQVEPTC